jgi:hypothetical protein
MAQFLEFRSRISSISCVIVIVKTWSHGLICESWVQYNEGEVGRKIVQALSVMVVWVLSGWGFPTQSILHAEMHVGLHSKFLLFLSNLNQNWNVLTNFSSNPQYQISWKSVQWFWVVTCRQTDMAKIIGTFFKLLVMNTPKNQ